MSEEGGTKLQKRPVQQISPQMSPQQQPQMSPQQQPQMSPQQQPQMSPQQYQQPQQQYQQPQQRMEIKQIPDKKNKRAFGFSWNDKNVKNSLIVVVIFILLNSRMIWKVISKMPMMGSVEPSILALIVNSIIAGIVFYIISTKFN